mgnify:CR=1 FL=1
MASLPVGLGRETIDHNAEYCGGGGGGPLARHGVPASTAWIGWRAWGGDGPGRSMLRPYGWRYRIMETFRREAFDHRRSVTDGAWSRSPHRLRIA